ncbi:MAG: hypothetical protein ABI963_08200 [Rhizomicrobium sp.]
MVDVPAPFELEVEIIEAGTDFTSALDRFDQGEHLLAGLWLLFAQRHTPHDGDCNLYAFREKPDLPKIADRLQDTPCITGFVHTEVMA